MKIENKLYIYIDESGTLGLKKEEPFFLATVLIINDKRILKIPKKSISIPILKVKSYIEKLFHNFILTEIENRYILVIGKTFGFAYYK